MAAGNALIFLALALLHGYWALGGKAGLTATLPAHPGGGLVFRPPTTAVWLVAAVLLGLAGLSAAHLSPELGGWMPWLRVADGVVAAGLLLRGVGDFRFVGLTKRVCDTTFARLDTRYYTPLCLLLAASSAGLAVAG